MILIRSIYIIAIGICLFLFLACLSHQHPGFVKYVTSDMRGDSKLYFNTMVLIACIGIAYRFIRQEDKR